MDPVQKLMQNEHFMVSMKTHIDNILADGHIDAADIPEIILMALDLIDQMPNLSLDQQEYGPFLEELISSLMKRCGVRESDRMAILKMTNVCIALLMRSVKVRSAISRIFCCKRSQRSQSL